MKGMDFTARYAGLNTAQKEAVDTIDGPVMVIAGPGTGKTELLSMRVAMILQKTDTLPENILCLTFTESGANAMRERLLQIIGPAAYKVAIHTFHSFGAEVMNRYSEFFYYGSNYRPADELASYELLEGIFDGLSYDNPLVTKLDGEYVYLRDTLQTISELKRSGLTSDELLSILDANDAVIDAAQGKLSNIFANRLTKALLPELETLVTELRTLQVGSIAQPGLASLAIVLADTLEQALAAANEHSSTKPITAWRNQWMKKDETGTFILKAYEYGKKLRSVSSIYYHYLLRMQEAKLYDFDDMILRVVHAMEVFGELRFNLQEHYHYLMVDEFQDTNLAQMRILQNLTNNEVHGDTPNIMVVGDDDQAIYSFQGADVGNIHGFLHLFPKTKRVVLTDNYRSAEPILHHARAIITQGETRLERLLPDLDKALTPHMTPSVTKTALVETATANDEHRWIAKDILRLIKSGVDPSSIAILARRHRELEGLLPSLFDAGIPVSYERQHNVLDLAPIQLLEHIANILVALFEERHDDANAMLPELLAHPAFAIPPLTLWRLSLAAQEARTSWMEMMSRTPELQPLHTWLVTLSQEISHTPLEHMLDHILGITPIHETDIYSSPVAAYYFSAEKRETAPETYLDYLEGLRAIRTRLIEHRPDETPTLQAFLEFIQLHREHGSTIMNLHPASKAAGAIHLLTAHKSKGMEFEHVYVIGAVDSTWGERVRTRSRLIGYPQNLPLAPAGDTYDERLRLFFVAITRARSHLTVTYSLASEAGKPTLPASFLLKNPWHKQTEKPTETLGERLKVAELAWYHPIITPLQPSMQEALLPLLKNYRLSATHVNAFLDITGGGPESFLVNNLLRFPQAKSPSASYGSAVHTALQRAHAHLRATGKQRPHEDILHDYEEALRAYHLPAKDFQYYLQKGSRTLSMYLEAKYATFSPSQRAELNFAGQSVFIGDTHLTGTLDVVDIRDKALTILDYKTGRPARNWQGRDEYEKIKLHKYKQQLMFYCLLVAHSRDFSSYEVEKASLEFVEPTAQDEIITLEARFSQDDLKEFSQLIQHIWNHIVSLNLPDITPYEKTYAGILAFEQDLLNEKI